MFTLDIAVIVVALTNSICPLIGGVKFNAFFAGDITMRTRLQNERRLGIPLPFMHRTFRAYD